MPESEPLGPARGGHAVGLAVAGLAAGAFAASFGFNYGVGNQVTYLIPALRRLDPELLSRDWFATQTTQYHPVFSALGAALLALDRRGWALALALTLTVALGGLVLYALSRKVSTRRAGLAVFLLLVTLAFATQTRGPALTYVFDRELQPSTLSSVLLLGGALAFSAGRFLAAGSVLALAGLFHLNFLLLGLPAFGIAQVLLGRKELGPRLVKQLALPALAVVAFLPMLAAAAAPTPGAAFGRHVYLAIRAPHHFVLAPQLGGFLPLLGWQCLAAGATWPLTRGAPREPLGRLSALSHALAAVVWLGVLAGLASERAASLFAWRLAPHCELLLELTTLATAVTVLLERAPAAAYGRVARGAVLLGLAGVLGAYVFCGNFVPAQVVAGSALLFSGWWLVAGASHARPSLAPLGRVLEQRGPELLAAAAALLLVSFAVGPLMRVREHSSLLAAPAATSQTLVTWMREHTPKQALFLTPPDEDFFRFFGERAIVVDWKGNPAVPAEVLAWYRRLEDVTGRRALTGVEDLAGYDTLDAPRLESLRRQYGFDYAVVRRGHEAPFAAYPHPFENAGFVVIEAAHGP